MSTLAQTTSPSNPPGLITVDDTSFVATVQAVAHKAKAALVAGGKTRLRGSKPLGRRGEAQEVRRRQCGSKITAGAQNDGPALSAQHRDRPNPLAY